MRFLGLWTALILASGCGEGPTRDVFGVDGVVRGTVRTGTGTPVGGAWVAMDAAYPLGNGSFEPLYDSVRTGESGEYTATLGVQNLPDAVASLTVRVWPPLGSPLAPGQATGLELALSADLPSKDTLVVDFSLAPQ